MTFTSFLGTRRGRFAAIGYLFDETLDAFVEPTIEEIP